jgi:hypothetical protein
MAAVLVFLSAATFGVATWRAWFAAIPGYLALVEATGYLALVEANSPRLVHFMPTIAAAARVLGLPVSLMQPLQVGVSLLMVGLIWRIFRRGVTPGAAGVLGVAAFLATPYAFIYDLPVVTLAVVVAWEEGAGRARGFGEIPVLLLGLVLPVIGRASDGAPAPVALVMPVSLVLLLLVLLRRAYGVKPAAAQEDYAKAGE